MIATQLSLDLFAVAPPKPVTLSSPWCAVAADLLARAWQHIQPRTAGQDRLRIPAGGEEAFEVAAYPFGWAVVITIDGCCGHIGSCMSAKTPSRLLRQFLASFSP